MRVRGDEERRLRPAERTRPAAPSGPRSAGSAASERTVPGYLRIHVPRRARGDRSRQAGRHHGRLGCGDDLQRARRHGEPGVAALLRPRPPPGDHVALCMENHPLFLAIAWGAHYAGLYYTAASSRLTTARARVHRRRLRSPGLHHVRVQGRAGRRAVDPERPTQADARRHRRRLRTVRGRRSPAIRPSPSPTESRATTCSTRRARPDGRRA